MRVVLAWALVLGTGAAAAEPTAVAVARFRGSNTLMQRLADRLTFAAVQALDASSTLHHLGPLDLGELPSQQPRDLWSPTADERRPCDPEEGSCLARSAPVEDASWMLIGHLQGDRGLRRADLQLVSVPGGRLVWRNGRALADDPVVAEVDAVLQPVLRAEGLRLPRGEEGEGLWPETPPPPPAPPVGGPRDWAWVVTAGGGALLAGGGVAWGFAAGAWGRLHSPTWKASHFPAAVADETAAYNGASAAGAILVGVGAATALGGVVWALLTPEAPPAAVRLVPLPGGLALEGRWP